MTSYHLIYLCIFVHNLQVMQVMHLIQKIKRTDAINYILKRYVVVIEPDNECARCE